MNQKKKNPKKTKRKKKEESYSSSEEVQPKKTKRKKQESYSSSEEKAPVHKKNTRETPEKKTREVPEKKTREVPEKKTREVPEKKTKEVPEKNTRETPEKKTREVPEKKTNEVPKPTKVVEKTIETPEKKTREVPEKKTNEVPKQTKVVEKTIEKPQPLKMTEKPEPLPQALSTGKTAPPEEPRKKRIAVHAKSTLKNVSVYEDWGVTLNQTNFSGGNNNNKFYVIQLLTGAQGYHVLTVWGRVGEKGKSQLKSCPTLKSAMDEFCSKFRSKTQNNWLHVKDSREDFKTYPKAYELIDMLDEEEVEIKIRERQKTVSTISKKPCTLNSKTQALIKLIFDHDMFQSQMKKLELDVSELPLGALSPSQIDKGYIVLDKIADLLDVDDEADLDHAHLEKLTSSFYRIIPHSFGRRKGPTLSTAESVQRKRDMLSVLGDIKLAHDLKETSEVSDKHELDINYGLLDSDLTLLDVNSTEYKYIYNYFEATKNRNIQLLDVFRLNRHSEGPRFSVHNDTGNRRLLWHGTNVAVVVAILKTGLRIMPHSGGRVGRGIYFASENAKSANYVGATAHTGIMFLSEVVLGNEHSIVKDDPTLKTAPPGFDCVIARGWTEPDPAKDVTLNMEGKEVKVPQGKPINMPKWKGSNFTHTEYVVYKESQCRLRYLLKIQWDD